MDPYYVGTGCKWGRCAKFSGWGSSWCCCYWSYIKIKLQGWRVDDRGPHPFLALSNSSRITRHWYKVVNTFLEFIHWLFYITLLKLILFVFWISLIINPLCTSILTISDHNDHWEEVFIWINGSKYYVSIVMIL